MALTVKYDFLGYGQAESNPDMCYILTLTPDPQNHGHVRVRPFNEVAGVFRDIEGIVWWFHRNGQTEITMNNVLSPDIILKHKYVIHSERYFSSCKNDIPTDSKVDYRDDIVIKTLDKLVEIYLSHPNG